MRIVVVGATGNVGTSLVRRLAGDERVREIVGVARRRPRWGHAKTTWVQADVERDAARLPALFEGADAVVHLAWLIQPSRDEAELHRVNVEGSRRVFEAAAAARAGALVYASSVGVYSPGPKDRRVDESWPTGGIETSFYARHKSAVEHLLDGIEAAHPDLRVVRLRPGLIFKAEAATEIRRYFTGPLLPSPLIRPGLIRVIPDMRRLALQAVHADDVAEAYRLAIVDGRAHGAYNVAAEPVIDPESLAREFGAVRVPMRAGIVRALADVTWRARLQPTPPGWLDMGLAVPLMDTTRIRGELGWRERRTSMEALRDLLGGMGHGTGLGTPPLDPQTTSPARLREVLTGVGGKNP